MKNENGVEVCGRGGIARYPSGVSPIVHKPFGIIRHYGYNLIGDDRIPILSRKNHVGNGIEAKELTCVRRESSAAKNQIWGLVLLSAFRVVWVKEFIINGTYT